MEFFSSDATIRSRCGKKVVSPLRSKKFEKSLVFIGYRVKHMAGIVCREKAILFLEIFKEKFFFRKLKKKLISSELKSIGT